MSRLQSFFNTPARQALGWTTLGLLGILMAAGGIWFLTDGDDGPGQAAQADDSTQAPANTATPTATRSATTPPSPSPSPSPTPSETPSPTPTTRPAAANPGSGGGAPANGGGQQSAPEPPATPVPDPTQPPVVAGGDYCPPANVQTLPSGRVAGAVTVGGAGASAGSVDVFLAFDGVLGPGTKNIDGAFRIDFWAGGSDCANRVGAAISVYANGQFFPTGRAVGDGAGQLIPVTVALP